MNCRVADGGITPTFDQMTVNDFDSVSESHRMNEEIINEDSMIPLARLPGQWFIMVRLIPQSFISYKFSSQNYICFSIFSI